MNYEIGQKLYRVPYDRRYLANAHDVVITAIGRKWLTVKELEWTREERVDKEMLIVDGGQYSSPAKCYLSKQHYEDQLALNTAWDAFVELVHNNRIRIPQGGTVEAIEQAKRLLFGEEVATP